MALKSDSSGSVDTLYSAVVSMYQIQLLLSGYHVASYPGLPMFFNVHEKNREDLVDLVM